MYYTSLQTAWAIEQGKFHHSTGVWPLDFPYGRAYGTAVDRGISTLAHTHLLNLARLNQDLAQLAQSESRTHGFLVRKFRKLAESSRLGRTEVSSFRGVRFEALIGGHLAANGYAPFMEDDNPRVNQEKPDFSIEQYGTRLYVECGSLEPTNDGLEGKVRSKVWSKALGARGVKPHVGPDTVLVLDVTNLVARTALRSGAPVDLFPLQREVMRALSRFGTEYGTTWGGVLLHIVGTHAEVLTEPSLRIGKEDGYSVVYLGDSVALTRLSWKHQLVARSFFGAVTNSASSALSSAIDVGFPTTRLNWTVHFDHLAEKLIY